MLDANVLFAASTWPRFPYEVLQHAVAGDYTLVLTPRIIAEAREAILEIAPHAESRLEMALDASEYEQVPTPEAQQIAAQHDLIRDPKDVHVALAAIQHEVDLLITQDRDFTDHDESTEKLHQQLSIMLPGTFLRLHMGWTSDQLEAIRHRNWSDLSEAD